MGSVREVRGDPPQGFPKMAKVVFGRRYSTEEATFLGWVIMVGDPLPAGLLAYVFFYRMLDRGHFMVIDPIEPEGKPWLCKVSRSEALWLFRTLLKDEVSVVTVEEAFPALTFDEASRWF